MKKPPDLERLIADLQSGDSIDREAAVARLRLAGPRAIPRLSTLVQSGTGSARVAALTALEGIDDERVIAPALAVVDSPEDAVVIAALGVLRCWIAREEGTQILDAVTPLALDDTRDARVRKAALDALTDLPPGLVQPIVERIRIPAPALRTDTSSMVADDPASARALIAAEKSTASLTALHELIVRIRELEGAETSEVRRREWLTARAAAHAALAERDSRIALYDLRETFAAAHDPLPLDMLTAVAAIGDSTCLEPMARAWAAAPQEIWWRERLSDAAADITRRMGLSGRTALIKRIRAKWAGFI